MIVKAKVPHELRYKPSHGFRLKVWSLIKHDYFDFAIMSFIMLNMLQMAIDHEGASDSVIIFL